MTGVTYDQCIKASHVFNLLDAICCNTALLDTAIRSVFYRITTGEKRASNGLQGRAVAKAHLARGRIKVWAWNARRMGVLGSSEENNSQFSFTMR